MWEFYCIVFIEYMLSGKTLLDYTNLFFLQMNIKRMKKQYVSIFKMNMAEEANFEFRLRKIDEARNYVLGEIKYNYLRSEKFKRTCKYLNYVEHLLILVSIVTGCVSVSAFISLVCVPFGIASSAVGTKICAITARI